MKRRVELRLLRVRKWLLGKAGTDWVGTRYAPSQCPLAIYLRETFGGTALVHPEAYGGNYTYYGGDGQQARRRRLPAWANRFAFLVDHPAPLHPGPPPPHDGVTAAWALECLEQAAREQPKQPKT